MQDERELRELTKAMLERNGDVVAAGDGQSALALSRHHKGHIAHRKPFREDELLEVLRLHLRD